MYKKLKSLKSKIFIGYLIVIFILIIVTLWSINNFNSLSDAINNIMVENYRSIKASESMIESLERQDSGILMLLNGRKEDGNNTFQENEREFYRWLTRAEDNITIDGEEEIINEINNNYLNYTGLFEELKNLEEEDRREFYYENILATFYNLKNEIRDLRSINQNTMVNAQQKADQRADKAIFSTSTISILAVVMAIFFGFYLSNLILKPVNELKNAVQKVADKNFEQKINVKSEDEIGDLALEFNEMIERLQEYEKMNINKLVKERDKSRAIVNNITSPLLVTDRENKLILLNQEARRLFGLDEDYLNRHFLEVINNEQLFEIIKNEEDTAVPGEKNKTIQINKGEREYHFKVASNSVKTDKGEEEYTITLLEDVTKLKEIDEMKSEFVSTVSHEFRTPLTSMNMSLSMLLEEDVGSITGEQRELLTACYEDCERLNNLVNDLLDLSRIESGKIEMEFDRTSIKQLVNTTIKPFSKQADEKNIEILTDIKENIFAWADPSKISWVISNLIGNALRYTPEGGKIEVDAEVVGRTVKISVTDTGVGIPGEYQEKIFEKFVRANNNQDDTGGTGLGLAISREIIEAHNGSIWVESKEGEGSRFIFEIPKYRHLG